MSFLHPNQQEYLKNKNKETGTHSSASDGYISAFIGYNIQKVRKLHKYNQRQLADGIGKSRASVALYETGKATPPIEVLYSIADFCEVPITEIVWPNLPSKEQIEKIIFKPKRCKCEHCNGKGWQEI